MRILTEKEQVRGMPARWRGRYGLGTYASDKRRRDVGAELAALNPETATAQDVSEIIGVSGWVEKETCCECGEKTWDAVGFDVNTDDGVVTAAVCRTCLAAALSAFDAAR